MLPYRDSRITQLVLVVFFLLLAGYAYFEARGLLFGPSITVDTYPTEVTSAFVVIAGRADRISSLTMNGSPVEVTETGAFSEPYLLAAGYNRIVLDATDKYGRQRTKTLEIVYTPPATSTPAETSTTTPPAAGATTTKNTTPASTTPANTLLVPPHR